MMISPLRIAPRAPVSASLPPPGALARRGVVRRLPNAASLDDAALAHLAAVADPRAPAALWDRYSSLLRGILRRMLGPGGDLDDLVQDAFIGLHRTLPGLRDPEALRSFVVGTALRVARSELRRRRVRRWVSLTATGAMEDGPREQGQERANDPDARRAVKRLYELLDTVGDRGRVAFVLRHFEGYELTEVAASLGCSVATTKRVLSKVEDCVHARVKRDPLLAAYLRGDDRANGASELEEEEILDAAE